MATFKGLFGRTLVGKAQKSYIARSVTRARKQRERTEAYLRMQANLERQRQAVKDTARGIN